MDSALTARSVWKVFTELLAAYIRTLFERPCLEGRMTSRNSSFCSSSRPFTGVDSIGWDPEDQDFHVKLTINKVSACTEGGVLSRRLTRLDVVDHHYDRLLGP
jgi:hypothetical protein